MKRLGIKRMAFLITFAGIILLLVLNFSSLVKGAGHIGKICTPFFAGIFLAFILNMLMVPIDKFLSTKIFKKKKGLAKGIAIFLSYLFLILIIVAVLAFVIPELATSITRFINNWDTYAERLTVVANDLSERFDLDTVDVNKMVENFTENIEKLANNVLKAIGNMVPVVISFMSNIVSFLFNVLMAIVISANILVYKERLISQISRTTKAYLPKAYPKLAKLSVITADTFKKYVSGQCIEAVILGMLCYIGMVIFRFDYAILISTVIAVTALIPVAGAYIGGGVAVILLALISPIKAILFLIYLGCLQQFETNLIYPKVVGTSLELPGIWVIFAVTFGGGAFGFLGILFAVPVMSVIYKLLRESVNEREAAVARGEGPDKKDRSEGFLASIVGLDNDEPADETGDAAGKEVEQRADDAEKVSAENVENADKNPKQDANKGTNGSKKQGANNSKKSNKKKK